MHRMLIVDDEPIINDGLYEYFRKADIEDLEIVRAFSATEAIDWLNTLKIDLVLSDICMPEMSGMELIREIVERWPRCKVILLTGHNEFEYAHEAIRNPCVVDYLLKTEGMDRILHTVQGALVQLGREQDFRSQAKWFQDKLPRALPQLQRQLLRNLSQYVDRGKRSSLQDEFEATKLPFSSESPVLPVLIQIENWGHYQSESDRELIRYAVTNIAEELLQDNAVVKGFDLDVQLVGCYIQPRQDGEQNGQMTKVWDRTKTYVHGIMEAVQQSCADCLNVSVSILIAKRAVPWSQVGKVIGRLRAASYDSPGFGMQKLLVIDPEHAPSGALKLACTRKSLAAAKLALEQVKMKLIEGSGEWTDSFQKWVELMESADQEDHFLRMRLLTGVSEYLLDILEETGLSESAIDGIHLHRILEFDKHTRMHDVLTYYQNAFEWVVSRRTVSYKADEMKVLTSIHHYIKHHLHDDLSLTRIAREVSLNPSYLSRWYKRITGKGISQYINEKRVEHSKELLLVTDCKMHEISAKVGFSDQHYFYRFFKKAVGCTPQEYRERRQEPG